MDTILSLETSFLLISSMWTMTIGAIIGIIVFGIDRPAIRIIQLLITTAAWSYAFHSLYAVESGQGFVILGVLFLTGAFAAGMTTRFNIGGGGGLGGCFVLIFFFTFACFLVWIINIIVVLICCLSWLAKLTPRNNVIAFLILVLTLLPIIQIFLPISQFNIVQNFVIRPIYKIVVNRHTSAIVDNTRKATRYLPVKAPALFLSGGGNTKNIRECTTLTTKELAKFGATSYDESGADSPAILLHLELETNDEGTAKFLVWKIRDINLYSDVCSVKLKGSFRDMARGEKLQDGDEIVLCRPNGELIANIRVNIYY